MCLPLPEQGEGEREREREAVFLPPSPQLAPAYEGQELGIGESVLMKAIAGATGRKIQQIKADVVEKGDLGLVAEVS